MDDPKPGNNGANAAGAGNAVADAPPPVEPSIARVPPASTPNKKTTSRKPNKRASASATKPKRAGAKSSSPKGTKETKSRRTFPASTFGDALVIAQGIQQFASGQKIRRLTLFDNLKKSPDSGPSRQLITNSGKYGLTKGGYQSEWIELTPDGATATNPDATPAEQRRARFELAIQRIAPFSSLYEQYKGNKLPAQSVMRDHLSDQGFPAAEVSECVDTFILNAKELGLLRTLSGAERILSIDQVIDELPSSTLRVSPAERLAGVDGSNAAPATASGWSKICFYITPIGEPESEQRKHSDLFLSSIVEPAMAEFGLTVVRADHIGKPGMITAQIIEHVINARLVIADLSFHNPNVFYELCLRHACRKPTVQLIRAADSIPFDLEQFRTITIDNTDIYTLVPQLETYKSEIASHTRRVLDDPDAVDNPLTVFCPGLTVSIATSTAA